MQVAGPICTQEEGITQRHGQEILGGQLRVCLPQKGWEESTLQLPHPPLPTTKFLFTEYLQLSTKARFFLKYLRGVITGKWLDREALKGHQNFGMVRHMVLLRIFIMSM